MNNGRLLSRFCRKPSRRGRRRRISSRAVIDAIFYLLRTGCQWRQLPRDFPAWSTVTGGLKAIFPAITTVIADAGRESKKLARALAEQQGWRLQIVKRRQRAFKITGLTWIVERSFAWLGRNRRLSKDYEHRVQTSETMIDIATTRLMLNRLAIS
jgi:transposase